MTPPAEPANTDRHTGAATPPPPAPAEGQGWLCERCGYGLAGTPIDRPCPECGLPAAASSPEQTRPGTAWQRDPGALTCLVAMRNVLSAPRRTFRAMRVPAPGTGRGLIWLSIALTGAPVSLGWMVTRLVLPQIDAEGVIVRALGQPAWGPAVWWCLLLASVAAMAGFMRLLIFIEETGIRFFGRQRGWRITRDVARGVCGHAALGWVAGAWAGLLAMVLWEWGLRLEHRVRWSDLLSESVFRAPERALILGVGLLAGMVLFELLVYLGVRQCRYANPRGAASRS